jgi:outer membrane receptor protein involved in Fe transport
MSQGQDASIRYISRGRWQVDALAYLQARNFSNIVISSTSFRKSLDQRNTPSTGIGGKIELRPPVGEDHVLRIGVDTRFATGDMYEDAYNAGLASNPLTSRRHAGGDQITSGIFAEDDWTIGQLVLTGGVRADRWSIRNGFYKAVSAAGVVTQDSAYANRSDWAFSGRAGALYHLSDAVALRGAAYSGFRLPTLNELYRPFVVFPITTQANAALKPEKLKGLEGGIDLTPASGVRLSATLFYNRLDDAIANVTLTTVPNTRERQNVKAIVAKGVELTASAQLPADFSLLASYAYSHSKVDAPGMAFDGFAPAQVPRHSASATLAWAPKAGPELSATLRYVAKQYEDVLPDALTLDALARLPIGPGISLVARGENLFDEDVVTRNAAGSIDLGTPRTLWIGVTVRG